MSNDSFKGTAAALVSNIIFGLSFMFTRIALDVSHPLIILAVRFTVAFLFMSLLALFGVIKINYRGKNLRGLLLMALSQPFCYFLVEIYGIKYTSSALSGIIISLIPIVVIFLSALMLKESPTVLQIVCSAVSLTGVAAISLLTANAGKNYAGGVFLLIAAVICASVFNVLSRREAGRFSPAERTYFMFLIAAVGFNIIALAVFRGSYLGEVVSAFSNIKFTATIIYLGAVSSCLTFLLYNYATSNISVIRSAAFANVSTVVSVLAGIVFLREEISVVQLALCVPIIAGVFGVNYYGK